jgi:hypothetical protein
MAGVVRQNLAAEAQVRRSNFRKALDRGLASRLAGLPKTLVVVS